MAKTRAHVFISGRVQGVFFRSTTRSKAKNLSITGWVKNLKDGRVEAVFEGEDDKVKEMLDFCHEGSSAAQVSDVEINWEEYQGEFSGFEIRYEW
ncbi:acylphosphatase [candidate division MSBL1 archaeon SCGC-AAA261F19]|uniref:Acylphosphatase n=2 Tax=candidate division MSBL1 TaxID=215777 RepID=A0A133VA08_9EURY|nr:acylphosphatase [candidate division MSBL1 archaeon SCGC-AAA261D19]KXB03276.1 acylphosphatase [candidate division MSBL1 archaeon SCGC-AAA261F19]